MIINNLKEAYPVQNHPKICGAFLFIVNISEFAGKRIMDEDSRSWQTLRLDRFTAREQLQIIRYNHLLRMR